MPSSPRSDAERRPHRGRRYRLPTLLFSFVVAVPVAIALPVATLPGASPHAVAPKIETWNATADLQAAARAPRVAGAPASVAEHKTGKFSLVGVRWSPNALPAGATIQLRTGDGSGAWSGWTTAEGDDTGVDPGTKDAVAAKAVTASDVESAPIYAGTSDSVQVRVIQADGSLATTAGSVRVITIDPGTSAADGGSSVPASVARAAAPAPAIHTRAEWGADESLRARNPGCGTPAYSDTIQAAIVHHTDGTNNYSAADVPSIIRGIYAYHVVGRGYCDIAYNFLVDRFGQIWEGRYGGVGSAVLGAHSGGFNTRTTGVAVLGTYTSSGASAAAVGALQTLLAWKLGANYADPLGTTVLTSGGGDSTAYPAGTQLRVNVISGHRDVDQTGCPGAGLYGQLPAIRSGARNLLGTGLIQPVFALSPLGSSATFSSGLTTPANWSLVLRDGSGAAVRTFTGSASTRFSGVWDGRSDSGSYLPVGGYSATISASGIGIASSAVPYTVTFALAGHRGDAALVVASGTASGKVEVHVADQTTHFQTYTVHAATPIPAVSDPGEWQFRFAPFGGDGQRDLWAIWLAHTGSGNIEVHVLSAQSNYQTFLLHQALPIPTGAVNRFSFGIGSYGGDGASDLFATFVHGSWSGKVEVHVLSASSLYTSFIEHVATAMPTSSSDDRDFLVGDPTGSGDLTVVYRNGSNGKTDVHVLSRASGYSTYSLHAVTAFLTSQPGDEYSLADYDGDGRPDLCLVRLQAGSQSSTEVHVLTGADGFATAIEHALTALPKEDPAIWTAALQG